MNFDADAVVKQMLAAAMVPLAKYWKAVKPAATAELTQIAQIVEQIGIALVNGKITKADAEDELESAKDAAAAGIAFAAGAGEAAAEDAANAAIDVALGAVSSLVNGYVGFALI